MHFKINLIDISICSYFVFILSVNPFQNSVKISRAILELDKVKKWLTCHWTSLCAETMKCARALHITQNAMSLPNTKLQVKNSFYFKDKIFWVFLFYCKMTCILLPEIWIGSMYPPFTHRIGERRAKTNNNKIQNLNWLKCKRILIDV